MDIHLPFETLLNTLQAFNTWVNRYIISYDFLINLIIIISVLVTIKFILWRFTQNINHPLQKKLLSTPFSVLAPKVKEINFLIFFTIALWFLNVLLFVVKIDAHLMHFMRNVITAWLLMRVSILLVQRSTILVLLISFIGIFLTLELLGILDDTTTLLHNLQFKLIDSHISLYQILSSVIIVTLTFFILDLIKKRIDSHLQNSNLVNAAQKVLIRKLFNIMIITVVVLVGLSSLGFNLTALAVFSGAIGLGIGLGLQRVIMNVLSGFFILMDRSIKPGDVIAIGDTFGWVNSLQSRYISIITRDGKEHLIPNEKFITDAVENWSYSSRSVRIKLPVTVSYNTDLEKAAALMCESATDLDRVLKTPSPACLIKEFGNHGIHLELRIWIQDPNNGVSNLKSIIYFNIWHKFKEHNIEIPYPQMDVYLKNQSIVPTGQASPPTITP